MKVTCSQTLVFTRPQAPETNGSRQNNYFSRAANPPPKSCITHRVRTGRGVRERSVSPAPVRPVSCEGGLLFQLAFETANANY